MKGGPDCPHCTSGDIEDLGRGWWRCNCCSKHFKEPAADHAGTADRVRHQPRTAG